MYTRGFNVHFFCLICFLSCLSTLQGKEKRISSGWKTIFEEDFNSKNKTSWSILKQGDGFSAKLENSEGRSILNFRTPFADAGKLRIEEKFKGPLAVEVTAKTIGMPCDMSIFMDSPGKGPAFQFGSNYNQANFIWTFDGKKSSKKPVSADILISRKKWHTVRFELKDNFVSGYVDGKLVGRKKLGENYDWNKEFQPMFYLFDTNVFIDKILVQVPLDKASIKPELQPEEFVNSIGLEMRRVVPGTFFMGEDNAGEFDEKPAHKVIISKPFYMSATEITNAQYEKFDPKHKRLRGMKGLSKYDNDAVVNISWYEAVRFCQWLSKKEGKIYRLPTEAEWEYVCRAGTNTLYYSGDSLPLEYQKHQERTWNPLYVCTDVRSTPPNHWGFYGMHGNVEEWCSDWYGPYKNSSQIDPSGRGGGNFKVTRSGSHNTRVNHLRSAKRFGNLPDDSHWLIGFRIVEGALHSSKPLKAVIYPNPEANIVQAKCQWKIKHDPNKAYFLGPRNYVKISKNSRGPLYSRHNHQPAITFCPNGDLLAIWFSCDVEPARQMSIGMSRLRYGNEEWDEASAFWLPSGRNATGCALWTNKNGKIFHFNGINTRGTWANLAMIKRTSDDNGKTWSKPEIIFKHGNQNQVVANVIKTASGQIIVLGDAGVNTVNGRKEDGTALHISSDNGKTWTNPTEKINDKKIKNIVAASKGAVIAGLHGAVVELNDGRLFAFGRGSSIKGQMPLSISRDGGKTWEYSPSGIQPHGMGQRIVLMRLSEGTLFFAGFANKPIVIVDIAGKPRKVRGLFVALSYDEGKTWPIKRLVTDDKPDRKVDGGGNTHEFILGPETGERAGYLACVQTPDGIINLISSKNHYAFNKKWIETPMPEKNRDKFNKGHK